MIHAYYYDGYCETFSTNEADILPLILNDLPPCKKNRRPKWHAHVYFKGTQQPPERLDRAEIESLPSGTWWLHVQEREEPDTDGYVMKKTYIRNHSKKRIHLEYKKIKDTREYILWRANGTGTKVSKVEYDKHDLPEEIQDNRF